MTDKTRKDARELELREYSKKHAQMSIKARKHIEDQLMMEPASTDPATSKDIAAIGFILIEILDEISNQRKD